MTTVIRVGDRVSWSNDRVRKEKPNLMPMSISGCTVTALFDIDGKPAATIDCNRPRWHHVECFVADLEPEEIPDKTTILSGG